MLPLPESNDEFVSCPCPKLSGLGSNVDPDEMQGVSVTVEDLEVDHFPVDSDALHTTGSFSKLLESVLGILSYLPLYDRFQLITVHTK